MRQRLRNLPDPVQKVVKGILPKGYFAKPSDSAEV